MAALAAYAWVAALHGLDIFTTLKCVASGNGHEANPIVRNLMARFGPLAGLACAKAAALALSFPLLYLPYGAAALLAVSAVYIRVVWSNWKIATRKP